MGWRSRGLIAFIWGMSVCVKRVCTQVPKALHWIDTPEEEKQQMAGKRHVFKAKPCNESSEHAEEARKAPLSKKCWVQEDCITRG